MNMKDQLLNIGFEPKGAEIYLTILEYGPLSVSDIAKNTKIKRPTVYYYIDDLLNKNFIQKSIVGKKILYIAQDPQRVVSSIEEKKRKFEMVVPQLRALYQSPAHQPKIRFYEGKEGITEIYKEIFSTFGNIYAVFSPAQSDVFSDDEIAHFFETLRKHEGKIYDLVADTEEGKKFVKQNYLKGVSKNKFLPSDVDIAKDTDFLVEGNKTAIISLKNMSGVLIENKEIAQTQMALFKALWKNTK